MMYVHRFGHNIIASTNEDDRIEQRPPAARTAAPVDEELLNKNITPDTTLYDHYQPYQQQHSPEEAALEQLGRTVSSTSSSTSLLLEKSKEQEKPSSYYVSSRKNGGCFTPLPEDFPPPSPEEWEKITMFVRELV